MALGQLKKRSDFVAVRDLGVFVRAGSVNLQVCWAVPSWGSFRGSRTACPTVGPPARFVGRKVRILVVREQSEASEGRLWVPARVVWVVSSLSTYIHGSSLDQRVQAREEGENNKGSTVSNPSEVGFLFSCNNEPIDPGVETGCPHHQVHSSLLGLGQDFISMASILGDTLSPVDTIVRYGVEILEIISSTDARSVSHGVVPHIVELECRILTPPQRITPSEVFSYRKEREAFSFPPIILGITASRKVGNAVERNFAKRRIRAWCYEHLEKHVGVLMHQQGLLMSSQIPRARIILLSNKSTATLPVQQYLFSGPTVSFDTRKDVKRIPSPENADSKVDLQPDSKAQSSMSPSSLSSTKEALNSLPFPVAFAIVYIANYRTPRVKYGTLAEDMRKSLRIALKSLG